MKVWIVEGSTGEYEDCRDWIVKAFLSEKRAKELQKKLDAILMKEQLHYKNYACSYSNKIPEELLKLDPGACIDYTGAVYNVYSMEVEE